MPFAKFESDFCTLRFKIDVVGKIESDFLEK